MRNWSGYLKESSPPHNRGCPCTCCDAWRVAQVKPGDLCTPLIQAPMARRAGREIKEPEKDSVYTNDRPNMCATWEHDGPLLWGYRPPEGTLLWCLWENPRPRCDAHMDPITILLPDCRIRVTSKAWLEVVQKAPDDDAPVIL